MMQRFWYLYIFLWSFAGCDQLTFRVVSDPNAEKAKVKREREFSGVSRTSMTSSGQLVLMWEPAKSNVRNEEFSYEIYQQVSPDTPEVVVGQLAINPGALQLTDSFAPIYDFREGKRPVDKGVLMDTVGRTTRYKIEDALDKEFTYLFQIVAVTSRGISVKNSRVVVYRPGVGEITGFAGITATSLTANKQLILQWDRAIAERGAVDFVYDIYRLAATESPSAILERLALSEPVAADTGIASIYAFPEGEWPQRKGQLLATVASNTRYEISDAMDPDLTYLFQVVARSDDDELISNPRVALFRPGLAEIGFTGIETLTSTAHGTATLSWQGASDERVVGYRIYAGSDFSTLVDTVGSDKTSYHVLGLTPDLEVTYGVRAIDRLGQEDLNRKTLSVVVLNNLAPEFLGLTSVQLQNGNQAVLRWQPAAGNPKEYRIYQGTSEGASAADVNVVDLITPVAVVPAPASSYTMTALGDDQEHHFLVRAATAGGAEEQNLNVKMVAIADLGAPLFSGIEQLQIVSGGLEVSWPEAVGQVSSYRVYASESSPLSFTVSNIKGVAANNERRITLTGLKDQTTWYVGVRAIDQYGAEDANSKTASQTVSDLTPPNFLGFVGSGAEPVAAEEQQLRIRFRRSTEADVASYSIRVRVNGSGDPFVERQTLNQPVSGDLTTVIDGLVGNTTYDVMVKVLDEAGNISESEQTVTATTVDLTPPTFLGVSTVTRDLEQTPLQVDVNWDPAISGDAVSYRVYYSKSSFSSENFSKDDNFPLTVNSKTIASRLVSGGSSITSAFTIGAELDEDSTYYFIVRATDAAGNEDSNRVQRSFVTPVVTPPTFAGLQSASLVTGTRTVTLNWTEPDS